jgi:hypothetical protein
MGSNATVPPPTSTAATATTTTTCPPVAASNPPTTAAGGPCGEGAPVNPELNITATNAYKKYPSATPKEQSAAGPTARRIAASLLLIKAQPPRGMSLLVGALSTDRSQQ